MKLLGSEGVDSRRAIESFATTDAPTPPASLNRVRIVKERHERLLRSGHQPLRILNDRSIIARGRPNRIDRASTIGLPRDAAADERFQRKILYPMMIEKNCRAKPIGFWMVWVNFADG